MTIAIDGPVASGKTVVGKLLAARLGARFLDTGAMYRAVTREALERGLDLEDSEALAQLVEEIRFRLEPGDGECSLTVNDRKISSEMTVPEVERTVSLVAAVPGVRRALVDQQRTMAREGSIVMVGRDIGTVVLPEAAVKVFLTASVDARARRRHQEIEQRDEAASYRQVVEDTIRRDRMDSERVDSPLRQAEDAVRIVTDELGIEAVVRRILALVEGA